MPHLNKKQNKNTNLIISRQDYHLTQPCPQEEKQTNKQTSAQISPYTSLHKPLDQTCEGQTKRKKEFNPEAWEKETSNTVSNNNNSEKAEKYYTKEGTN